jgi:hypothetical protein
MTPNSDLELKLGTVGKGVKWSPILRATGMLPGKVLEFLIRMCPHTLFLSNVCTSNVLMFEHDNFS